MSKHVFKIEGDTAICTLTGDLDLEEGAILRKKFWDVIHQDGINNLVVALHQVTRLDPSAISLLVSTQSVVVRRKRKLVLVGLGEACRGILEQTHLDQYFEIQEEFGMAQ